MGHLTICKGEKLVSISFHFDLVVHVLYLHVLRSHYPCGSEIGGKNVPPKLN